jgi:hypothetical protein
MRRLLGLVLDRRRQSRGRIVESVSVSRNKTGDDNMHLFHVSYPIAHRPKSNALGLIS